MADASPFADLGDAQLHYLKAQYLASLQMVDQTEAALKAQLEQITKSRKQLDELMAELDAQIAAAAAPTKTPAKPAKKPSTRRTTRRQPVT
jgi:cell division protein FtsB